VITEEHLGTACVCMHFKRKMALFINTKLSTHNSLAGPCYNWSMSRSRSYQICC